MISLRNPITKEPNHPESFFFIIPKDILFIIARYISSEPLFQMREKQI